jgi:hypothetical protein
MSEDKYEPDEFQRNWLRALQERFGPVAEIRHVQVGDNPNIIGFFFPNLPHPGSTTAVTCGLSRAEHPAWKLGRPELMVTMRSDKLDWGLAAAFFASNCFGQKKFTYGDIFNSDMPLADDTEMKGFLLLAPAFLDREQAKFDIGDKPIHLVAAYPLYEEEIALYHRIGLEAFVKTEGFELDNPARKPLQVAG